MHIHTDIRMYKCEVAAILTNSKVFKLIPSDNLLQSPQHNV